MLKKILFALFFIVAAKPGWAHPMPNSVLLLNVKQQGIDAELQLPLKELQLAFAADITNNTNTLIQRLGPDIGAYIIAHMHPVSPDGNAWTVHIKSFSIDSAEQTATGPYQELKVFLWLQAPANKSTRQVNLYYDGIVHQVVTHKILVAVKQDWQNGQLDSGQTTVGIIKMDVRNNVVHPLIINLDKGSNWTGFKSMVLLGMAHISEGTDHLLFLLVLLLPATLVVKNARWAGFGGTKYSVGRLIKIITAFTLGHSFSLLLASLHLLVLPRQPVEIAIACTILITAIHAIRPVFPGKEVYVAITFGLIHGLAFATVLADLNLEPARLALSIFGFNLGIELMQLFVILVTIPWLVILSTTALYNYIRIPGAFIAIIAAIGWIVERCQQKPNVISIGVQLAAEQSKWLVLALAFVAICAWAWNKFNPSANIKQL